MKRKSGLIDLKAASRKVFQHYIGHLFPNGLVTTGRNISNPFLLKPQKTPSFNILRVKDGSFIYKDYATGELGNCVSFVAKMEGINRIEAIRKIRQIVTNK